MLEGCHLTQWAIGRCMAQGLDFVRAIPNYMYIGALPSKKATRARNVKKKPTSGEEMQQGNKG